jgi:hypothetical protein
VRVYASTADLADFAGADAVDEDSLRLLARASEEVDSLLLAAVYETTADGLPVDPTIADALKRATCAVVEWWAETGDETGAGRQFTESQIGTVRLKRADNAPDAAPRAMRILAAAGLLAHPVLAPDRHAHRF